MKVSKEARESFGEFIRQRRQELGLGIREIERITDGLIKAPYLSRIEHGRENPPGVKILTKLAEILEVDRDEMFAIAKKIPPEHQKTYFENEKVREFYRMAKADINKISDIVAQWEKNDLPEKTDVLNARISLLQSELNRWKEILIQQYNPEKIILFGSFANQKIHSWTDIDLIIIKKTDLPFLRRTREVIRLLNPMVGADFLVYTPQEFDELCKTRRFFKQEVLAKGTVIFERTY